jgi:hypothetical protein
MDGDLMYLCARGTSQPHHEVAEVKAMITARALFIVVGLPRYFPLKE